MAVMYNPFSPTNFGAVTPTSLFDPENPTAPSGAPQTSLPSFFPSYGPSTLFAPPSSTLGPGQQPAAGSPIPGMYKPPISNSWLPSTQLPGATSYWSALPGTGPQQLTQQQSQVEQQMLMKAPTTTGGGSLNPTTPNIFLPPPPPSGATFSNNFTGGSPDKFLADYTNNTGYLTNIAGNAGFPTSVGPAWDAMVAAQQRNIDRGAADLSASFAGSGNRFSSDFGNAAVDYQTQARANQNALLGQMTLGSSEAARARELQAAQQLSQQGFQGGSQLSNQDFLAQMQQGQFGFQSGQNDLNRQLQSALAFMNTGYGASSQLASQGAQGAFGLQAGSIAGAQNLFNTSTQAAQNEVQRQIMLQQMQLNSAQTASQLWQSNLGLGNTIGQGQFQDQTAQAQANFQEWLRTQPQYNPLLQMMFSGATGYPQVAQPVYQPSWWQSLLGAVGSIAGGVGSIFKKP